jgi:methylenetetrahydrofolate reductase (NADPH)
MPTRISEYYKTGEFGLSIEIFPPKTPKGDDRLSAALVRLAAFQPDFISCTYGAGGSTRDRTLDWCEQIQTQFGITATAHLTCVGATRDEITNCLTQAKERGIGNIMALRGDPPAGEETFQPVADGLHHANELVELIRDQFPDFGIGVAGYPETHLEAPDWQTDLDNLKRKVDTGAHAIYTQLFYVNDHFLRFRDRCESAGISVPIVPGIMPITEFSRIQKITTMCGTDFPPELSSQLEAVQDDKPAQFEIGVNAAIEQCHDLREANVPGIHFYALNKSQACERILEALGFEMSNADCA